MSPWNPSWPPLSSLPGRGVAGKGQRPQDPLLGWAYKVRAQGGFTSGASLALWGDRLAPILRAAWLAYVEGRRARPVAFRGGGLTLRPPQGARVPAREDSDRVRTPSDTNCSERDKE